LPRYLKLRDTGAGWSGTSRSCERMDAQALTAESKALCPVWSRTATQGPELDVVQAFLERCVVRRAGHVVSVFCEPRLDTGYPDVVLVHWDRKAADAWPVERAQLTVEDVRLLHFLHGARSVSREEFGCRSSLRHPDHALERLVAARVVKVSSRRIRVRPLAEIFAVRRLIALEAKISDCRRGLQQAFVNTWFASESFLLLRHVPKAGSLLEDAARLGVGVLSVDQELSTPQLRARRDRLPQSYASWLFNEWAWRGFGIVSA
jgi:hypothetical protein